MTAKELIASVSVGLLLIALVVVQAAGVDSEAAMAYLMLTSLVLAVGTAVLRMAD